MSDTPANRPARIFISYSRADAEHLTALQKHLSTLKRHALIEAWSDRAIEPGATWSPNLLTALRTADIVMLLVSPDFMASDYIHDVELKETFERHARGEARVIPVLVRPTDLKGDRLDSLQGLPKDRKPITTWKDRDEAWLDVVKGIRSVLEKPASPPPAAEKLAVNPPERPSKSVPATAASPAPAPGPTLTLLHLSDLHFGQDRGQGRVHLDQKKVLEELRLDAQRMAGKLGVPDLILVTGDIVFSGQATQYADAKKWLQEFASSVGVSSQQIWVVPGNHDVDRALATKPLGRRTTHVALRAAPAGLDDYLLPENTDEFRTSLWPKFNAFAAFSSAWASPSFSSSQPFWRQECLTRLGKVIVVGLNSSLLCLDDTDAKANLALSKAQLRLLDKLPGDALILAALHHPPEWLSDGEDLWKELQKHPHILFSGHVHALGGGLLLGAGQRPRLRSDAGAAHADPKQPGHHSYSWLQLTKEGLDWYPRAYTEAWNEFRAFAEKLEDEQRFQRFELPPRLMTWAEDTKVPPRTTQAVQEPSPRSSSVIWSKWLTHVYEQNRWLAMSGIHRPGAEALRTELDQVYVELQAVGTHRGPNKPSSAHPPLKGAPDADAHLREGMDLERSLGLHDVLQRHKRLLILGDPGSGKTTLLRYIARKVSLAWLEPDKAADARSLLKLAPTDPLPIPVLLPLAALNRYLEKHDIDRRDLNESHARAFLQGELDRIHCCITSAELQHALTEGHLLLLLDGLDEVPGHADRLRVADAVGALVSAHPKLPVVMTSRTRAFHGGLSSALSALECFVLQPMSPTEVSRFLHLWFGVVHSPDTQKATEDASALVREIEVHRELSRMMLNPNILTLIAILKFTRARLPDRRVELYSDIIDLFLERKDHERNTNEAWERLGLELTLSEKRLLVARLALEMHEGGGEFGAQEHERRGRTVSPKLPAFCFGKQLLRTGKIPNEAEALEKGQQFLDWLELRSGLLRRTEYGVEFTHLAYQEFLVGLALSSGRDEETIWRAIEPHLTDDWWNEPIRLLLAQLEGRASGLLLRLARAGEQSDGHHWPKTGRGLALAFGALQDIPSLHLEPGTHKKVLGSLEVLTGRDTKVPVKDRIEALLALGQVGDPRLGMEKPERWVWIAPGTFTMGSNENEREKPPHKVTLTQGYCMGRFPVTNAEFKPFIDAGGYSNRDWWKADAGSWEWREKEKILEPGYWRDAAWNAPNQPVVCVSWFEARAYCQWLTHWLEQQRPTFWTPGLVARLATEAEWEYAARGPAGRKYPWGTPEPTPERANYDKAGIGRTSPVGAFPLGATPETGLCDMAGNVWEWCADAWHKDYQKAPENGSAWIKDAQDYSGNADPSGSLRVIRGGSWLDDPVRLRGACRGWPWSRDRGVDLGFRVVWSVSLGSGDLTH